jgi:hypothetical protein
VTKVNGLRLAYRGFVSGLAGAYVWAAIAMTLSGLVHGDPLAPLRPIAAAIAPVANSPELAFVIGLAGLQSACGLVGMCFAYFFARYFTVRSTLAVAAPAMAVLTWAVASVGLDKAGLPATTQAIAVAATLGYGVLLGANVPLRGEVTRQVELASSSM